MKIWENIKKRFSKTTFIGIGIGAVLGYAYYYFIGCQSGSCAITSSPTNSVLYGALIGLVATVK